MTSEDKNGPEKRQGLEAKTSVEDSIQKFTNKVLPGIFSKSGQKMSISSEKQRSEIGDDDVFSDEKLQTRRKRIIICAVLLLCMAGALQGILVNGLINVVISTIEKRFGIRSTETGFIANSYDIASFLFLLPVSYLGGRGTGSKPVWIGAGIVLMGMGSLLFSFPHFSAKSFSGDTKLLSLCNSNITHDTCSRDQDNSDSGSDNSYKFVFMASQLLHGAGAAPLYTLGVTYIDENIGASSSAFFLGVFYTMAIVGPAIGYSLGGHLLSIHTDFLLTISPDDPSWIGAWWLGFVICGASLLIIAWPILLLPATVPGMREPSGEQTCRSRINSRTSSFRTSFKGKPAMEKSEDLNELTAANGPLPVGKELLNAIIILVTNPTFICVSIAGACEGFLMQGLATFLPKMIQYQFNLSASKAAMYVGAVSVVAGGGGTLLGGIAVRKLGLKVKGLLKMTSTTQFMAILTAIGLVARCPPMSMLGPHSAQSNTSVAHGQCNCECDSNDYNPVCSSDGNQQFYNPCYAGCQAYAKQDKIYLNCSCIPLKQEAGLFSEDSIAIPGQCESNCVFLPVFLVSFFLTMCITFLANIPSLTATLRCVDPSVRSLALGIQWLLIRLLGTIPGPVAMGKLFDNACDLWSKGCDGSNNHCLVYKSDDISISILTLTVICKGLSIAFFLSGVRLYKADSRDSRGNEENS